MTADRPLFSIIIATRNRSALFPIALRSVLEQRFHNFEVIVINDGSAAEHEACYQELVSSSGERVRLLRLVSTKIGHGQSYVLNYGAVEARGEYLCFLDDDDQWIDSDHLGRAAKVISSASAHRVDLILANQQAYRNDEPVSGSIWIEDLRDRLQGVPDLAGAYTVTAAELLLCSAHCHVNTTIISRNFYLELDGLDEGLRYECDRDFYLRAIDRARVIKYIPAIVSRHNIPDSSKKENMSTVLTEISKRLYQLRVFDKAVLFSARPELRCYAMRQRAYILKHIATEAWRNGQLDIAAYYAREALMAKPTLRWLGLTALLTLRSRSYTAVSKLRGV